jgi:alkanesulfonate monooxygenase SsuD/methylene tetrahydromethanopterin reductase-like flavin-dependent oxidoreductase (luciferase family)
VNLWPQPIQKPHPPIWIPGLGSIETWDFCIERGYNYSYLSFSGYKRAQKMMDGYWDHMAKRGKPANPYTAAFFQQVCISERDEDCELEWWPHVDYFFNKCLHLYPGMAEAPGYRTEASLRAGIVAQVGNTTGNMGMNKTWKELCEQRYIVAGSPATVRQQLEELARSLRVGHLLLGLHIGSAPAELVNRSTHLCATQVLPHLRSLFAEYEDVTWPKALPAEERAKPGRYREGAPSPVGAAA